MVACATFEHRVNPRRVTWDDISGALFEWYDFRCSTRAVVVPGVGTITGTPLTWTLTGLGSQNSPGERPLPWGHPSAHGAESTQQKRAALARG